MVRPLAFGITLLCAIWHVLCTPLQSAEPPRRPHVIWHGLGDSYASPGMLEFINLIKDVHLGLFVHSVYIEEDLEADQKAGFVRDSMILSLATACLTIVDSSVT